jgi:hypothetical protein
MDEMERAISLKAIKFAWAYTGIFLIILIVYDYVKLGKYNPIAYNLLISQNLVKLVIEQYLKRKMGKNEE